MSFQSFASSSRELLNIVAEALFQELQPGEALNITYKGEETDYLRFNQSKVRQNTSVVQRTLTLQLQKNQRTPMTSFTASGNLDWDLMEAREFLKSMRADAEVLPADPFMVPFTNNGHSFSEYPGKLLTTETIVEAIVGPAKTVDMAGFYTGGTLATGTRNSLGQDHWFATESFFLDYSLYNGERAVTNCYANNEWLQSDWEDNLRHATMQLEMLNRPRKKLSPGKYKVYLAPDAVRELSTMLDWQGLSFRSYKDGANPLKKLKDESQNLSPLFSVQENFGIGLSPRFNEIGELAPETLPLIEKGQLQEFLTNSRSAKEFGVSSNQASNSESTRAMEMAAGTLKNEEILAKLETGLYLSNLHYINWSDLQTARVTGMTRFACLWVENGEVIAPIEDMRFDVSLYDVFGADLLEVTDFQKIMPNVLTYEERGLGGKKLPGMLIGNFHFTL